MNRTGRIIINTRGVSDSDALHYVKRVVDNGKISGDGKHYCYYTVFNNEIAVVCSHALTGTITFTVYYSRSKYTRDQAQSGRSE